MRKQWVSIRSDHKDLKNNQMDPSNIKDTIVETSVNRLNQLELKTKLTNWKILLKLPRMKHRRMK